MNKVKNMKPLTVEDLVIGKRYVPHSKDSGEHYTFYHLLADLRKYNQDYVICKEVSPLNGVGKFYIIDKALWFYLSPSDVTEYIEPEQNTITQEQLNNSDFNTKLDFCLDVCRKKVPEFVNSDPQFYLALQVLLSHIQTSKSKACNKLEL